MLAVLKRNLVPIIFFAFVGMFVYSFFAYRTEEQESIRRLILMRRAGTVAVQEEIRNLNNLSLVATAEEEDYQKILNAFAQLNQTAVEAKESLPRENISEEYTEYVTAAEEYFDEYLQSSREVQELFEQKYVILPDLEDFSQNTALQDVEQARRHLAVVEYLVAKTGVERETNFTIRVRNTLQEILADEVVTPEETEVYRELRGEEEFFVAPGLHLIQFTAIDDADVLEKFQKLESVEKFLRSQYDLVELETTAEE